jgi:DNA-binding CsgD family transcriptional regulator
MPEGEAGVLVTAAFELVNPLTDPELRARYGLSAREIEVARLVSSGLSNQEVAEKLGVSYFTARNHVERLLAKLGVGNRSRVGVVLRNEAAA